MLFLWSLEYCFSKQDSQSTLLQNLKSKSLFQCMNHQKLLNVRNAEKLQQNQKSNRIAGVLRSRFQNTGDPSLFSDPVNLFDKSFQLSFMGNYDPDGSHCKKMLESRLLLSTDCSQVLNTLRGIHHLIILRIEKPVLLKEAVPPNKSKNISSLTLNTSQINRKEHATSKVYTPN